MNSSTSTPNSQSSAESAAPSIVSNSSPVHSSETALPAGSIASAISDSPSTARVETRIPVGFQNPSVRLAPSEPTAVGGDRSNEIDEQSIPKENKVISAT